MRNYDADVTYYDDHYGERVQTLVQVKAHDRTDALRVVGIVADNDGLTEYEVDDLYEVTA